MTNHIYTTAGLPLFESPANANGVDIQEILDQAKIMRARAMTNMVCSIFAGIKNAFRAQRTARKLNQLSDAVLADIGIERSQIPSISRQVANGTYVQPSAEVTVIAPAQAATDTTQPELPLAA
jgi:uncharacterized protein YjiS (DUF1127 family)